MLKFEGAALAFPHPGPLPPAGEGAESSFRLHRRGYGATGWHDESAVAGFYFQQ